jgi:hypothetical protein
MCSYAQNRVSAVIRLMHFLVLQEIKELHLRCRSLISDFF